MPYSYHFASSEFNLLCQSQIKLLAQALGALWSAIYLTEESVQNRQTKLFPFMIYPQTEEDIYPQLPGLKLPEIWQQVISEPINESSFLLPEKIAENSSSNQLKNPDAYPNKQLVLPLIHENTVMGLLIVAREDRNWENQELAQVENVATTLAVARFLELQSQWYRKQLRLQQEANNWQKDRLDDLLHQLRNPLTALKTFSKLLMKRLLPDDPNQSLAESMLRETNRLSQLLQQFEAEVEPVPENSVSSKWVYPQALPFKAEKQKTFKNSFLGSSQSEPLESKNFLLPDSKQDLKPVELKKILEPLLITTEAIASEKNIELVVDLPTNIPLVKGNAQALTEVFNNLIDNALKYTPSEGTVKLEIKIQHDLVGIVIQDTGHGIPAAVQPQIFQRHYRGIQESGAIPGSGLGLAIAKTLVEQMQGKIELISPNNFAKNSEFPGTTFIVWMPRFS